MLKFCGISTVEPAASPEAGITFINVVPWVRVAVSPSIANNLGFETVSVLESFTEAVITALIFVIPIFPSKNAPPDTLTASDKAVLDIASGFESVTGVIEVVSLGLVSIPVKVILSLPFAVAAAFRASMFALKFLLKPSVAFTI